jgi:hypothetical protein
LDHGKVSELTFDTNKWVWENDNNLLDLIVVKRRKMLNTLMKLRRNDDLLKLSGRM